MVLDPRQARSRSSDSSGLKLKASTIGGSNDLNQVVGNTDASGQLTTTSSKLRASSGDGFRFTVDNVTRGSDTYNPGASVQDKVAYVP